MSDIGAKIDPNKSRTCKGCGNTYPNTREHWAMKTKHGLDNRCKACAVEKARKWREKNPDKARKALDDLRALAKQKKVEQTALANKVKEQGCIVCGYNRCLNAIDLHHVDASTKSFEVSKSKGFISAAKFTEELSKCVALCSNCHREFHAGMIEIPTHKIIKAVL